MPRDLPVGNGALLVNFDRDYQARDLYWPFVGQENHTAGHPMRFGVWVDGIFRWVTDAGWRRELRYQPETLLTRVTLAHPELALTLLCEDIVDFHENLWLRQVTVAQDGDAARDVRLFFAQDFHIGGSEIGDSAYYEPERQAVFHYKGKRWFLINTAREGAEGWELGVNQWAVGVKEVPGYDGAWRDAEDGQLSGHAVAQGSVDSCVALHLYLPARGQATGWYWIAVGTDFHEVTRINRLVRERGPRAFLQRTRHYWALWHTKTAPATTSLPDSVIAQYQRSLLILRTQIDNGGAVLASTDFDMAREAHDTYAYMWPRDGALIATALDDADFPEVTRRFYDFCHRIITPEGFMLHKYNPDGSLASSWLGWALAGRKVLPVQEDETALVLWALWRHFARYRDVEFLKPLFRGLVVRAANWLAAYCDEATGLPLPSWDLWEERRGIHAWTIGAVWGGLRAAGDFAAAFGEQDLAVRYRGVADRMKTAMDTRGWSEADDSFLRSLASPDDESARDNRADASLAGLWLFGMYPPDDPRIVRTMTRLETCLRVRTSIGGLARYVNDQYHRRGGDSALVPGNPWFICTLWWARWLAETAQTPADLARVRDGLTWAHTRALPSSVMAEQLDPYTGEPVSVSPLAWSHAEFIAAVQAYRRAETRLS